MSLALKTAPTTALKTAPATASQATPIAVTQRRSLVTAPLSPATWPRDFGSDERLLAIDPRTRTLGDFLVGDLPALLRRGDLLVLNDAATLPGSLRARTASGVDVELRLTGGVLDDDAPDVRAVLFGHGDWRTPTEHRDPPPRLAPGDQLAIGSLHARVASISPISPRLVTLRFSERGDALWRALYREGRPVQYAYLSRPLHLFHVQSGFASRPWAAEMPSAGRPLTWDVLLAARRRGVRLATLTHAAGLSSTGDPALDAALPLDERYDLPAETVHAIDDTRARDGRVVAVGTTVVRALEGTAQTGNGTLRPGPGTTDLRIRPGFRPQIVSGLLTGIHEVGSSHFDLLSAFADRALLERATHHASAEGYLAHEFGDSSLILPG